MQVCLMLARGSAGKGEVMAGEEGIMKAVHMKKPASYAKVHHELRLQLSWTFVLVLDGACRYALC